MMKEYDATQTWISDDRIQIIPGGSRDIECIVKREEQVISLQEETT
jgi:hypothetical protein